MSMACEHGVMGGCVSCALTRATDERDALRGKLADEVTAHARTCVKLHGAEARVTKLEEALRVQDPRNASARYDMIADAFYLSTGLWPPGRSAPPAMGIPEAQREEAQTRWRPFVDAWHEAFFDAALRK